MIYRIIIDDMGKLQLKELIIFTIRLEIKDASAHYNSLFQAPSEKMSSHEVLIEYHERPYIFTSFIFTRP